MLTAILHGKAGRIQLQGEERCLPQEIAGRFHCQPARHHRTAALVTGRVNFITKTASSAHPASATSYYLDSKFATARG
jgi:hypothetical protein